MRYLRDADHIEASVSSRWHDGEFADVKLLTQKTYHSLSQFSAISSADVSTSFKGLTSLALGTEIKKDTGELESSIYIQVLERLYVYCLDSLLYVSSTFSTYSNLSSEIIITNVKLYVCKEVTYVIFPILSKTVSLLMCQCRSMSLFNFHTMFITKSQNFQ